MTRATWRRRLALLVAPLLALAGLVLVASPAQAAVVTTFTVNGASTGLVEVEEGDTITVAWEVTGDDQLVVRTDLDGWDEPDGTVLPATGTRTPVPPAVGEVADFRIVATDGAGEVTSSTVSVRVVAADEGLTPSPVTFPDPCTAVVPESEGFSYVIDYGDGDVEELGADTYDLAEFDNGDDPVTFRAVPDRGVTVDPDAETEWTITPTDLCFGADAELVATAVSCGAVEFTNVADVPITVLYGDEDADVEDGSVDLDVGESERVRTERVDLLYAAFSGDPDEDGDDVLVEVGFLRVPQDCGSAGDGRADHPTAAPAAGVADADAGTPAGGGALGLLVAAGTLLALRAARRTA